MWSHLRATGVILIALTLLTGVIYPLAVTGIAKVAFARQASGSLIGPAERPVGSRFIGQPFSDPKYFWGRLSATAPTSYNGGSSSGSNLGPTNPALVEAIKTRIAALRAADPGAASSIPVDLVTSSASGLDPHISQAAAEYQIQRVARHRGMDATAVRAVVAQHTHRRQFGVLGEPVVNVLELNLSLDGKI